MNENEAARQVLDGAFRIHRKIGPGLFEEVYQRLLQYELSRRGVPFESEVAVPVIYDGITFGRSYRADLVVAGVLLVELKSVEKTSRVHAKQVLTYLKLSDLRLGLLINFGAATLREGITRLANGLPDSQSP
jgi:GxxExxY protein